MKGYLHWYHFSDRFDFPEKVRACGFDAHDGDEPKQMKRALMLDMMERISDLERRMSKYDDWSNPDDHK